LLPKQYPSGLSGCLVVLLGDGCCSIGALGRQPRFETRLAVPPCAAPARVALLYAAACFTCTLLPCVYARRSVAVVVAVAVVALVMVAWAGAVVSAVCLLPSCVFIGVDGSQRPTSLTA
jgi:hypothetical protein